MTLKKEQALPKTSTSRDKWVDHPNHYNGHKIKTSKGEFEYESIDLIASVVSRLVKAGIPADAAYCVGNAVKYIDRAGEKPADYGKSQAEKNAEEFQKAVWYLNKAAELTKKV